MFFKQNLYVQNYLEFLGVEKETPSLDYLRQLMETHIHKVPFDGSNFTLNHLMKPKENYEFDFVIGEKNKLLYYIKTKPGQESNKEEIKGSERANKIFSKFQVDSENIPEILTSFKL